jgi:hypothetical protein
MSAGGRGRAVFLLIVFVAVASKMFGGSRPGGVTPPNPGPSWSEDLAEDRRFERSLIFRELAAILLIGLLILVRQLLS